MIKAIHIKKFKSIDSLTINCTGSFNVLIGANNIGKTSIFEAIHLWKMCYDLNIKRDKAGFFANAHNLPFKDMEFIRVYTDMDLFPAGCRKKEAKIEIALDIEYNGQLFSLGFSISKVSNIDDAYLQISYLDFEAFKRFEQMVLSLNKKLDTFISVSETRPVANIIVKEPYMYKAQVMDKIAKGKGYEVLRNKIKDIIPDVENHINNVLQANYHITEVDRGNKQYISLQVDGKNILSYGSGFLQLAEIFSSIEYIGAEIGILLIDEPDAHLHLKMQKRLMDELRTLQNTQLFIITHNERFLEDVSENEILFIDESIKQEGTLTSLENGCKGIVLENLGGCLQQLDKLRFAREIILVEGQTDIDFLGNMCPKYEMWRGVNAIMNVYVKMDGIDTLNGKLISYARALKQVVPTNCKWLVIRDTDCVPISRKVTAGNDDKKNVDVSGATIEVIFQEGYGVESTFLTDPDKLARMLADYYGSVHVTETAIRLQIGMLNVSYSTRVKDITNPIYGEWKGHFDRQLKFRRGRVYHDLQPVDVLSQINDGTVQYIMTKGILDKYLVELHNYIIGLDTTITKPALNHQTIFTYYYSWMNSLNDMFDAHKMILHKIYS